jgi:hypothetical protein
MGCISFKTMGSRCQDPHHFLHQSYPQYLSSVCSIKKMNELNMFKQRRERNGRRDEKDRRKGKLFFRDVKRLLKISFG